MRFCCLPAKEETDMSPVGLLFVGLIIFAATIGDAIQQKDFRSKRNRRSLVTMRNMFKELTGEDGIKFVNYGNWCGLGGSGTPVDPLDGCCQNHDICYDELEKTICKKEGKKALYGKNYNFKVENGKATCDKSNDDPCATALCLCDVVLNNCVKTNFNLYNKEYFNPISMYDAIVQGDYLKNLL